MIGVNIQDHEVAAQKFIRQFGQTFRNGMDRTGTISIDFGVYGVPETFVIDQRGLIRVKYVGARLRRVDDRPYLSTPWCRRIRIDAFVLVLRCEKACQSN